MEVRLTFDGGDATKTFTVNVAVNVDEENPYQGTFRYEPEPYELETVLGTANSATITISGRSTHMGSNNRC